MFCITLLFSLLSLIIYCYSCRQISNGLLSQNASICDKVLCFLNFREILKCDHFADAKTYVSKYINFRDFSLFLHMMSDFFDGIFDGKK